MRLKYFKQISSQSFAKELITSFEKNSYIPLYWSLFTGCSAEVAFQKNHSGFGNFFELIFLQVCNRRKIPCEIIQENDADFLIDGTRFEMKTTKESKKGIVFGGSGVTINGNTYKKCGNYIFIGYSFNGEKIVSMRSQNKKLFTGIFYSVNRGIIKNEQWSNNCITSNHIKLNIPVRLEKRFKKTITFGKVRPCIKNIRLMTEEI